MSNYDYGDYSHQQFTAEPAADFAGDVVGSCFHQDAADTDVFPSDAAANFVKCNLTNCSIPAGCTVDATSQNDQIAEQNDGEQWVLDAQRQPMRPFNAESFDEHSISKLPADIPPVKAPVRQRRMERARRKADARRDIAIKRAEIAQLQLDNGITPGGN